MALPDEPLLLWSPTSSDGRGRFSKPFSTSMDIVESFVPQEIYYSVSHRGVIRGMHFQSPPHEIAKLVWVSSGEILDVVVDIRPGRSYGRRYQFSLTGSGEHTLFVPAGFAHGFQALEDSTTVFYAVDGPFVPTHDHGISFDSVDVTWPLDVSYISDRDRNHPTLGEFAERFTS